MDYNLRYQIIDLIWAPYHTHLAKAEYAGKYLMAPFWFALAAYQARLVSLGDMLAQLRFAKI